MLTVEYALFSMPPILYTLSDSEGIYKLTSNNIPMASYTENIVTNEVEISKLSKMLIYSDGLNENSVMNSSDSYGKYLKEDFYKAKDLKDLEHLRADKIAFEEDDVTCVMLV
jgi:serine phosphatase RsbU (regulator of sigma subunit)